MFAESNQITANLFVIRDRRTYSDSPLMTIVPRYLSLPRRYCPRYLSDFICKEEFNVHLQDAILLSLFFIRFVQIIEWYFVSALLIECSSILDPKQWKRTIGRQSSSRHWWSFWNWKRNHICRWLSLQATFI